MVGKGVVEGESGREGVVALGACHCSHMVVLGACCCSCVVALGTHSHSHVVVRWHYCCT